jgi:uncharacterized membrane protein YbhN (UPF0104 family)
MTDPNADIEQLEPEAVDEEKRLKRGIVTLIILVVLVGALIAAVPGLRSVAEEFSDVNPWWAVAAIVLELGSCAGYVFAFQHIFWRAPRLFATRVALSQMAFGAVVPAGGAGGIAIGAWIVKAKGGPVRRFAERSAVLFLLTSAVNVATLILAGLAVGLRIVPAPHPDALGFGPAAVGLIVLAGFACIPEIARRHGGTSRGRVWLRVTGRVVEDSIAELRAPTWRLAGAIAYLWCDIAMLWVWFRALGHAPPVAAITLAFLIGYLGNIIPVPGGIGVLDGGLAGALILYGASPTAATAATLAYHAVVLWVPTLVGTLAFLRLRRTLDEPLVLRPARSTSRARD